MKGLLAAFLVSTAAFAGAAQAQTAEKVFFLLPNTTTIRFESRDAPFFVAAMKEMRPSAQVTVQNAQGEPRLLRPRGRRLANSLRSGAPSNVPASQAHNINRILEALFQSSSQNGAEVQL